MTLREFTDYLSRCGLTDQALITVRVNSEEIRETSDIKLEVHRKLREGGSGPECIIVLELGDEY